LIKQYDTVCIAMHTSMHSNVQCDGCSCCTTDAKILHSSNQVFVTMSTGVGQGQV